MLIKKCEQHLTVFFSPPESFLLAGTGETCHIFCKISHTVRALGNVKAIRTDVIDTKLAAELSALPGRICARLKTLARCCMSGT